MDSKSAPKKSVEEILLDTQYEASGKEMLSIVRVSVELPARGTQTQHS